MLTSLALLFLSGLALAAFCRLLRLPRIIGMLIGGILLGPYVLNWLDPSILSISADLRQIALIIILLKAGLSLNLSDLRQVGRPAVLLAFLPASFEITGFILLAPALLSLSQTEAALMGAVLAAVSPAVVVPRMVHLIEQRRGTDKSIPQMILAGASCDDIYVIVLFSTFAGMMRGGTAKPQDFLSIPLSVLSGIALGVAVGFLLQRFWESAHLRRHTIRNSTKVILLLSVSFLLLHLEARLKPIWPLSGLLAVISMACVLKIKSPAFVANRLSDKLGKLWIAAEVLLFTLVGAAVDIRYTLQAGFMAVLLILGALVFRSFGVWLCVLHTRLNRKERLFCMIAYLPKATVQAAIGSVPLAMGFDCGPIILSVAVLAILITAPFGAIGIDKSEKRLLHQEAAEAGPDTL